ncbi:TetR/AcrR family transcriptional regulator [Fodinicola feengrottensis]|uniref:TetR/AcrR family transcriptional regulator n=1 Tax=Fodinicola feengrottensis TaxID=435914 RepID=A0ABN2IMM2_9ACTN
MTELPRHGYHHGDLRDALIRATDEILAERGVEGFTLREAARRAKVSPAAPAHHFGDAAGLLTEVAIRGCETLRAALRASTGADPTERLHAQALAYVRFALDHPGRFQLMFRRSMLKSDDPRLRAALAAAHDELRYAMSAYLGGGQLDETGRLAVTAAWSLCHGFAQLALDGKFDDAAPAGRDAYISTALSHIITLTFPPRN